MNRVRIVAIAAAGIGVAVVAGSQFQSQDAPAAVAASDAALTQQPVETARAPDSAQDRSLVASAGVTPASQPAPAASGMAAIPNGRPRTADELFIALTGEVPPHVLNGEAIAGSDIVLDSITDDPSQTPVRLPMSPRGQAAQAPMTAPVAPRSDVRSAQPALANASVVPDVAISAPAPAPDVAGPNQAQMLRDLTRDPTDPGPGFETLPNAPVVGIETAPLDETLRAELDNCAVWVVATPAPGAMLDFSIYAPCDRGADVTISHAELSVDARIGDDGQLMMMVPALSETAALIVAFGDGRTQSDSTFVPDLAQHERVVLQWTGPATMMLHAYEFGAQYGQAGHVHAGQPRAPGEDGRGFLTVLGDPRIDDGRRAQVYSYPRGETPRTGSVTLEIEAPVTDASCGKPLDAEAIEMLSGVTGALRQITLDMPDCDGQGGYVVLPGALPDLRIALN